MGADVSEGPIIRCPGTANACRGAGWLLLLLLSPAIATAQQSGARAPGVDAPAALAQVRGTVYDSIVRAPIAGAMVQFVSVDSGIVSRTYMTTSDESGSYAFDTIPAGDYIAGFNAPALDTLGIEPSGRLVRLRAGAQRVNLATPSPRTVIQAICPGDRADSTGVLFGYVRDTDTQESLADARVVVEWNELVLDAAGLRYGDVHAVAETRAPGWFALCELPAGLGLIARAGRGTDSSGFVQFELPVDGLRKLTFHLGGAELVTVQASDSLPGDSVSVTSVTSVLRGRARLTGMVRDERGAPIGGAHVMVWGTGLEVVTSPEGRFGLDGLPGGTHTVEARALGYQPVRATVQLAAERPATVDIVFAERVVVLDAVEVRGQLVYASSLRDFEQRRARGWGTFYTPDDLIARPSTRLSGMLQNARGVRVTHVRGGSLVQMRTNDERRYCRPTLWVDGVKQLGDDFDFLYTEDLYAVEVYDRELTRPIEFQDQNACGAIVVWTRPSTLRRGRP